MALDVYERLAKHLDGLPAGFPRTESGVELRILRRVFSPEDAMLALSLTLMPEEARVIARRAKMPVKDVALRLEEMERKGLVFSMLREGKPPQYGAQQFVVGFWEGQVNRLDGELVRDFEEYVSSYFDPEFWRKAPQLRTVPVNRSIDVNTEIMPYERAENLVHSHKSVSVSNCICRQERRILGKGCDKPEESCMQFGMAAESVVRNGRGRAISEDEALAILNRAEEVGLVLQPANAKSALFLCMCCGCCCGVLGTLKRYPKPADAVSSPFKASLDTETCGGCGTCTHRCQMEALHLDDGKASLNLDRCIGCGLCVSTCPTNALSLVRKPQAEQPYVPKNIIETSIKVGRARGRLGITELIGMQVRSKIDRLMAPR